MKASICIATYNRDPNVLRQVFASIFKQKPPFEYEVIVCDDGSHHADGSPSDAVKVACEGYPIQYHRIDRPPGQKNPCVPRNVAYRAARGDIIIAQSDEVEHQAQDTIETLVVELESHPGFFVIATVHACGPNGKPWSVYTGIARQKPWFFLGALWKKHLYQIGGNDEDFANGPAWDDEWFARCLQRGLGLSPFYTNNAVGHHVYHTASSSQETSMPNQELGRQKTLEAERTGVWCASGGPWPCKGSAPAFSATSPEDRINSVVVCVEYDDLLSVTLPLNKRHFHRTLVVTSPEDKKTQELARREGCECFVTDAFYASYSWFNKGLAIELALDAIGRSGGLCCWDADIVMPDDIGRDYDKQFLYCPYRRILEDPSRFTMDLDWGQLPRNPNENEFPGYMHLFHANGAGPPPWYSTHWKHAGGYDSDFEALYAQKDGLRRPKFEVLHLGSVPAPSAPGKGITRVGKNWCGRVTPRLDTGNPPDQANQRSQRIASVVGNRAKNGATGLRSERRGNIPRRMSFLWSGPMSWLRWVCLRTFMKQNPAWDVRLYMPTTEPAAKCWKSNADDDHAYTGPDYRERLSGAITVHKFDPPPGMAAPQLGGWFRWQVLSRGGGFFADTDFIWLKPLLEVWEEIRNADAMFCLESGYLAMGFMASCPNCRLFQDIVAALPPQENNEHEFYGVHGVYGFAGLPWPPSRNGAPGESALSNIRQRYSTSGEGKPLRIVDVPDYTVYPFDWRQVGAIWQGNEPVDERASAIHWFGGGQMSREHSHQLTPDNWMATNNTIKNYLERAL